MNLFTLQARFSSPGVQRVLTCRVKIIYGVQDSMYLQVLLFNVLVLQMRLRGSVKD